jgi:hypothetical protein
MSGEIRMVSAEYKADKTTVSVKITAEGLNVPLQDIIIIK